MKFNSDKYVYYRHGNETIAVSTYAGKTVRGVAKCHDGDTFDDESGKRLAAARCQVKVSRKRLRRADKKKDEAYNQLVEAVNYYNKMVDYFNDSAAELAQADKDLSEILLEI